MTASPTWRVRAFVTGTAALGSMVAATALATAVPFTADDLAVAGLVGVLIALSRTLSIPVTWKRERIGVNADEVVLLAAFALASPPSVVVGVGLGCAVVEVLRRHDPWKAVFNVASYVLAAGAAGAVMALAMRFGAPTAWASLLVPPVAALVMYGVLAQLFALMSGENPVRVFIARFGVVTVVSSLLGMAIGSAVVGLHAMHPLSPIALVPLVVVAWQTARTEARLDTELATRRALAEMAAGLVDCRSVETVADAVTGTSLELFDSARVVVEITPEHGEPVLREAVAARATAGRDAPVVVPIVGGEGRTLGSLTVVPREGARPHGEHERALASAVASAAAVAVATAEALAREESARRRLDAYLDASADAVLVRHTEGRAGYANAAARRLAERLAADLDALAAALAPHDRVAFESALETRDGGNVVLDVRATPVDDGEMLVVARDVTESRRLAEQDAQHRLALERSDRLSALGSLVAGVAHEVNNPLMYMRGQTELVMLAIQDAAEGIDMDHADSVRRLERVVAGIDRLTSISANLGSVAKGGTGAAAWFDVGAVVRRVTEVIGYGLNPGVVLDAELPDDPVRAHGDESALERALMHLVRNAVEAVADGPGCVRVAVSRDGAGEVALRVTDTGPGVPPDAREHIFSPFHTTKSTGTGLGLAFVEAAARAHGGSVAVTDAEGGGAAFTLRFPAAPAGAGAVSGTVRSPPLTNTGGDGHA